MRRKLAAHHQLQLHAMRAFGSSFSALFAHAHRASLLPGASRVSVVHGLRYGKDPRCAVDLYLPTTVRGPVMPTFVFVHGGGWIACDRRMSAAVGRTLAARGIAVAAPGYRLLPDCSRAEQRADVAAAFDFIAGPLARRFALDLDRMAIGGESAGAHLTLRTAQAWNAPFKPRAIVGVYGLYDVSHFARVDSEMFKPLERSLRQGDSFADMARDHTAFAPLPWNDVPVLLLHGEADALAPVDQSAQLAEHLRRAGTRVEVRTYPDAGHGFIYDGSPSRRPVALRAYRALYRFLAGAGLGSGRASLPPHPPLRTGSARA